MPSHLFADRPSQQPPERGAVDALISQTRRLRGELDAVRRDAAADEDDPQSRWQRALCELAVHQLDDLGAHLDQLRDGPPGGLVEQGAPEERMTARGGAGGAPAGLHTPVPHGPDRRVSDSREPVERLPDGFGAGRHGRDRRPADEQPAGSSLHRVGGAEWNLLTDEVSWSAELFRIFGRSPEAGPMTLDELPSLVFVEDQPLLTQMVTDCLIDGKPVDGEFRIVRSDGAVRTVHMVGEPVVDVDGCTASMWAVLRDVSELRRSERAVRESGDSLRRRQEAERAEHRAVVELQETVLPPWRGPLRQAGNAHAALELAGHYLPSGSGTRAGGDWYDMLELPDGDVLLTVGDLTGQGVPATSAVATLLGALRGLAVAGVRPGALMGHLNALIDSSAEPALGSAVCCRYDPATRMLGWAQAGHPAPLLFRDGTGRALARPDGVLLGATASGAAYEEAELRLRPGDVLLLHTDGLVRAAGGLDAHAPGTRRLLALGPRFARARDARDCVRSVIEEFGDSARVDDACVVVARVDGPPCA
ncbi:SpoIIE family protein phosphatase [Streptomyces sp. MUM 203J]|uniref:PP2C family protein-serine/threonine phosphatase n=1 Tax=Streptomyces sp. MUM 203J TaxID=2791990 RepID=UPI001F03FB62|nr:SpoIIE family protein phosphatase [Streptomyces sp. MUM 203J]MCH0542977.1 SpoIIE family protein phosphatase [Streptomyces sp. MUM 203J]